jgi:hypothetical protein
VKSAAAEKALLMASPEKAQFKTLFDECRQWWDKLPHYGKSTEENKGRFRAAMKACYARLKK